MLSASVWASAILLRPKRCSRTIWLDFELKHLVKASKGVGRTDEAEASFADSGGEEFELDILLACYISLRIGGLEVK